MGAKRIRGQIGGKSVTDMTKKSVIFEVENRRGSSRAEEYL